MTALTSELAGEGNAVIPVPGMPFSTTWAICASESRCTLELSAMFGARSPPRPSSPWHPAQLDAKVFSPRVETALKFCDRGLCVRVCELATTPFEAHRATRTGATT